MCAPLSSTTCPIGWHLHAISSSRAWTSLTVLPIKRPSHRVGRENAIGWQEAPPFVLGRLKYSGRRRRESRVAENGSLSLRAFLPQPGESPRRAVALRFTGEQLFQKGDRGGGLT